MEADDCCKKTGCPKKRTRKRPSTRKAPLNRGFINTAEARREIANALHHHRSSKPAVLCGSSRSYQLTDSIPKPEPTWSTTAPAVLCAPVPSMELLEVHWFDNASSSLAWWMGFLNSLDNKIRVDQSVGGSQGVRPGDEKTGSDGNDPNPFSDEWVGYISGG